jgi:pumilio RNA-binding family
VTSLTSSRSPDGIGTSPTLESNESNRKDAGLEDDASVSSALGPDVSRMETRASNAESNRNKQEEPQSYVRNMLQHHPSSQRSTPYQFQGVQAQVSSQGMNHSHGVMEKVLNGQPHFSSVEVQPSFQSPGLTPPLYATAAAYMASGNPYYSNIYPPGIIAPQYSMGGYALSPAHLTPYMTGFPSHGAIPFPFDATSGPSFSGRTASASTGEGFPLVGDAQHLSKPYGQQGLMLQPSFVDPHHMQYYPHHFDNAYSIAFHSRLASTSATGGQVDPFALQKESTFASYMSDQKLQPTTNGSLSIMSPRNMGTTNSGYFQSPPNLGVMTQFPASPLSSPLLPSSPVGGMNHLSRRNEMRFPQGSTRNAGVYTGWQGQRGLYSFDEPRRHSLLEELKSSSARKFELSDIAGRIVEFRQGSIPNYVFCSFLSLDLNNVIHILFPF